MKFWKFSSKGCAPCKTLTTRIETEISGVDITNVSIDENPEYIDKYKIRGVPTIIKFDDEMNELDRLVGIPNDLKVFFYGNQ